MTPKLPKVCPQCGGRPIIPIVYGLPGLELFEAAERGEVGVDNGNSSPQDVAFTQREEEATANQAHCHNWKAQTNRHCGRLEEQLNWTEQGPRWAGALH